MLNVSTDTTLSLWCKFVSNKHYPRTLLPKILPPAPPNVLWTHPGGQYLPRWERYLKSFLKLCEVFHKLHGTHHLMLGMWMLLLMIYIAWNFTSKLIQLNFHLQQTKMFKCSFNCPFFSPFLLDNNCFMVECWWWVKECHSLRKEAALLSGGMAADSYVSFIRWQQGEQTGHVMWLVTSLNPCTFLVSGSTLANPNTKCCAIEWKSYVVLIRTKIPGVNFFHRQHLVSYSWNSFRLGWTSNSLGWVIS